MSADNSKSLPCAPGKEAHARQTLEVLILGPQDRSRALRSRVDEAVHHWQGVATLTTQILLGLRFSEVRALEKKDLDLQAPGIWIRRSQARKVVSTPKNKRARFQVIPRALAEELQKFMLRTEDQLLFPDPRGGVLSNKVLNKWYAR